MAGISTYLTQKVIAASLQNTAYTPPAATYMALFTADPTDDNVTANEVSAAWYARVACGTFSAVTGTGRATSNSAQVTFAAVMASPVTVSHWGIYDAATNGNLLYHGTIKDSVGVTTTRTLNVGDIGEFAANEIDIAF